MKIFQRRESRVRFYSHSFPTVFNKAKGDFLYDTQGKKYIDFFCGAGAVNYGHNNKLMKKAIIDYLQADGIVHSLDMATYAKQRFLERFESVILEPRGLDYKIQFTGPTGTNANEAALKLVRMVKKRANILAFTNSFHGLTSGSLSITSNTFYRNEAFINRLNVSFVPFDGYLGKDINTIEYIRQLVEDPGSGVDLPAAVFVETVQSDGGVNVASVKWLQDLERLCRDFDILLVVDDIQVGNGRTGTFFSFEQAGIQPDIVTISKSISGFALPMSILLLKPELDQWKPGEHTGTFRGNNLAFVAATEAMTYWQNPLFSNTIKEKGQLMANMLHDIQALYKELNCQVRGIGMIYGLDIANPEISKAIAQEAFHRGVVIELCGAREQVLKFLPTLLIEEAVLKEGIDIIDQSIKSALQKSAIPIRP